MSISKNRWLKVFGLIVIASMLLAFAGPQAVAAGGSNSKTSYTVNSQLSSRNDSLQSLKALKVISVNGKGGGENLPVKENPGSFQIPHGKFSGNNSSQAVIENVSTPPDKRVYDDPMPGLDVGWDGIAQSSNRTLFGYGVYPPDTNGDASLDYYVQTVNTVFTIWDLNVANEIGGPKNVYPPAPINTLFRGFGGACEDTNDGDPIVLFDEQADRWLISQFALPGSGYDYPFYQCVAISQTSDPTGGYYRYEFGFNVMNDYPHFGIWDDGYYMTINQFIPPSFAWAGQGVVVFNRDAMLAGAPAPWFYFDLGEACDLYGGDFCYLGGMLPGDAEGLRPDAGDPNYVVQFDDDAWGYSGDQLQMWSVNPDWNTLTATMIYEFVLPVNAFDSEVCAGYARNCIPQPGTAQGLDAIGDRLMYRLQYRKFADHESMVVNHTVDMNDPAGHAGIRWYELRSDNGGNWYVYQQGDFAPDAANRWMGSIAMDNMGNIALGYSVSSGSVYPSIRYVGRKPADPLGTLPQTEASIMNGNGSQTGTASRWGDYSTMSVSPNGCEFYYTQEYYRGTGQVSAAVEWYTRVGAFHFPECLPTVKDTTGVFRPTNGALYLKDTNVTGIADHVLTYGLPGDKPITGDWDGNKTDTIGIYRGNTFYLRNSNTNGFADMTFAFGSAGDQPIAGDWNGDGITTIGVYRSATHTFFLRDYNSSGNVHYQFSFGQTGDVAVVGDWNGDGIDTVGVFRNGAFYLINTHANVLPEIQFSYGMTGDQPTAGDWDSDGIDTIGIYRGDLFYLRNTNDAGIADHTFTLGLAGDIPIAGNWDGLP